MSERGGAKRGRCRMVPQRVVSKVCPCGAVHDAREYWIAAEERWHGKRLCRACDAAASSARQQKRREDLAFVCVTCGRRYAPTRASVVYQKATPHGAPTCSKRCRDRMFEVRSEHTSPTCYAPVPGGCHRPRAMRNGRPCRIYCHGHVERKRRGKRMDTPIRDLPGAAARPLVTPSGCATT